MHRAVARALRTSSTTHPGAVARHVSRAARPAARRSPPGQQEHPHPHPHHRRRHHLLRHPAAPAPLRSSMFFRRLPVAVVSGLVVGYGAWYSLVSSPAPAGQAASLSFPASQGGGDDVAPTCTVLVVGADELSQATFVGQGPISKSTGDDGRRIVEVLTPDQATQKLRRLEQSFSVGRGRGVTRYDLAQLPSNDPIEDDHAEKIVKFLSQSAGPDDGASDWMFWGVFDGHSCVTPREHRARPLC